LSALTSVHSSEDYLGTYGGISDETSKHHTVLSRLITVDCSKKNHLEWHLRKEPTSVCFPHCTTIVRSVQQIAVFKPH